MMFNQILVLSLVLLSSAITQASAPKPHALIDDAKELLEQTKSTVVNAINRAHNMLEYYFGTFNNDSSLIQTEATVIMQYEQQRFFGQVTALEEVAETAGADITRCLLYSADDIQNLTNVLTRELEQCITTEVQEGAEVRSEYRYLIDISINRLYSVEFQLGQCDVDSEDCIRPLYEIIESERMYRAEAIEVSLIGANNLFNRLKTIVQECHTLNVSEYTSYVYAILGEIMECVDLIIN